MREGLAESGVRGQRWERWTRRGAVAMLVLYATIAFAPRVRGCDARLRTDEHEMFPVSPMPMYQEPPQSRPPPLERRRNDRRARDPHRDEQPLAPPDHQE